MISIISSLYKSDRYLGKFQQALVRFAQVLQNAGVDFELIAIVNDPTEAEKKFAEDFAKESWFKFINVGRETVFASFNRGVNLAKGESLGFWNVDDVRYPEAVIEGEELIKNGVELVYFPFIVKRFISLGRLSFSIFSRKMDSQIPEFNQASKAEFSRSMLCGPFFMFTKALYEKVGPFDEQFKIAGDFDWCARATKISDKFVKAKHLGGEFRVDGAGLSAGGTQRQMAENNIIYMRNHIWDKIVVAKDLVIKDYRPYHLFTDGKYKEI